MHHFVHQQVTYFAFLTSGAEQVLFSGFFFQSFVAEISTVLLRAVRRNPDSLIAGRKNQNNDLKDAKLLCRAVRATGDIVKYLKY